MGDRYGEKALESACDKIRSAKAPTLGEGGERNSVLYLEAHSLGGLVATERLNRSDVESALLRAAMSVGLDQQEAKKTIASGLRSGMNRPRWVEEKDEKPWLPKASPIIRSKQQDWEPQEATTPPDKWIEQVHTCVAWCHEKLLSNKNQMKFLAKRGINWHTVSKFVLGYNPGKRGKDIFRDPDEWGLPDRDKKLWLPKGLVIPCFGDDGRVVRLRFRRDKNDDPRYVVLPGSSAHCFVYENPTARAVIVVESELDAMLLAQEVGGWVSVVALGSASKKPDMKAHKVIKNHEVIFVNLDYDIAGAKAFGWWKSQYRQAKRLVTPVGKDPGEAQEQISVTDWIWAALYRENLISYAPYSGETGLEISIKTSD